ncbi:MAG: hypothetical protein J0I99_01705 [Devosia sp.]|uniref:hypothetical protein n=1 Tax=Devosia sp. TaxID=1871048 RepID=UPI001AD280D3|nr:hypothetical protein [Devosia sp.]MBN9314431.1 hypothetical protein [Devosia sp.]
MDFALPDGYRLHMPLTKRDRAKLIRILKLLGSDQPGESASAALAAQRLVEASGLTWDAILAEQAPTKVVVRRVREWDVNHADAAEARIRQLKATTERQERQIKALRSRVNTLVERERLRRAIETDVDAN